MGLKNEENSFSFKYKGTLYYTSNGSNEKGSFEMTQFHSFFFFFKVSCCGIKTRKNSGSSLAAAALERKEVCQVKAENTFFFFAFYVSCNAPLLNEKKKKINNHFVSC